MPNTRNGSWERQFEDGLPDCRVRYEEREKNQVQVGRLVLDPVFCANCGNPSPGGVAPDCPHVFYICDDCFAKANRVPPPGCIEVKM